MRESPGVSQARVVITTADFIRAVTFYRDRLGLPLIEQFDTEHGTGVILDAGRATLEILDEEHAAFVDDVEVGSRVAGTLRVAFEVADAATTTRLLADAGATVLSPARTTPWGSVNSRLTDSDGVQLTLFTEPGEA